MKYNLSQGDAFEWLANRRAKSIHAVVTDPPFGVVEFLPSQLEKRRNGNGGIWRLPQNYDGHKRSPMPRFTVLRARDHKAISEFHAKLAPLLHRVLVPGGHVILASQTLISHLVVAAFSDAGFEIRGQIVRVVKTLRGGDRPKGAHEEYPEVSVIPRSVWEPWLMFRRPCEGRVSDNLARWKTGALRRPAKDVPFKDMIDSGRLPRAERVLAGHPSQKPQAFMREIVWAALPLGQGTILDPFMGSGATLAAAEKLGLRSIGVELDHEFYEVAEAAIPRLAAIETANGVKPGTQNTRP